MNKVIISDELNTKEQSFFNKAFSKNKSNFKLSKDLLKFVNNIENRGGQYIEFLNSNYYLSLLLRTILKLWNYSNDNDKYPVKWVYYLNQ
jgi:hypothetical protein